MEKIVEQNTYVLQEDEGIGTVKIADDVVAIIAGLAATEVDGVVSMAGNVTNELMSKMGVKKLSKGVKVTMSEGFVHVDMMVNMKYGYSIPKVCAQVQERVAAAIRNMTGLEVVEVNLHVVGVNIQK